jgi:ketosteroid isomerase-like protein
MARLRRDVVVGECMRTRTVTRSGTLTLMLVVSWPIFLSGGAKMQRTETLSPSDLTTLLELNQEYIRSVQNGDVQRFREILADDFLCSLPDGSLVDKDRFLEQTARPVQISDLQTHDVKVRLMGDFAIVHARTTFAGPDGRPGSGRYTDVWARRNGRWLAVSAHVTRN